MSADRARPVRARAPRLRSRRGRLERQLGLLGHLDAAGIDQLVALARPAIVAELARVKSNVARHGAAARLGAFGEDARPGCWREARLDALVPAAAVRLCAGRTSRRHRAGPRRGSSRRRAGGSVPRSARSRALAAPGARGLVGVVGARHPQPRLAVLPRQQPSLVARHARGVGQVDDRRLQSLRGVHRQDAHLAPAVLVEVALDLAAARLEPAQEALQRCAFGALVLQRARQQLVDRIGRLVAQPLQQAGAAAFGPQRLWRRSRTA